MASLASFRILLNKIKWVLYENLTSVCDIILLTAGISPKTGINKSVSQKKIIVYVGQFLSPRIPRIAKWSKRTEGFYTFLICHKRGYYEKFSNPDIDCTILFRNKWHLKRLVRSLPTPYIVHGFAPKSKYPFLAMNFFKKYHPNIPFVADYQDVLAIYYGLNPPQGWLKKELPYEKACLQYADGIVAHSLEPRAGMNLWGIKEKKRRLFFPLYCDNDYFCIPKTPYTTDNIHLVYAGGIAGSHRDKSHYGDTQLHWLIECLASQKIYFHIYASPVTPKADYEEYEKIATLNSFFHFHKTVSQSDLPGELSKYHYGIMPFFMDVSKLSDLKYLYATTLKLFNYLEAGIPILAGSGVIYQGWLVERYKSGLVINSRDDFKDLRKLIEEEPYNLQIERVLENREKLSLKGQIPRLIEFYKSLRIKNTK